MMTSALVEASDIFSIHSFSRGRSGALNRTFFYLEVSSFWNTVQSLSLSSLKLPFMMGVAQATGSFYRREIQGFVSFCVCLIYLSTPYGADA